MTEYPQKASTSFNERMRLIRFRRKRENLRFWDEFKIVPRWLVWTVAFLYVVALCIALPVNLAQRNQPYGNNMFPWELRDQPLLASLALAGIVTAVSLVLASLIFLIGYVNKDAKRRGMNSALWTFLVIALSPAYLAVGFIIYFLMREPLPYNCPQCGTTVGARYNYCPNCKCNLHPSCPQCKREVAETDKYCANCGQDLSQKPSAELAPPSAAAY
jgi:hypothetical protein